MSTPAEHAAIVREALDFKPHWHTQAEKKAAALAAIKALEAQAEEVKLAARVEELEQNLRLSREAHWADLAKYRTRVEELERELDDALDELNEARAAGGTDTP